MADPSDDAAAGGSRATRRSFRIVDADVHIHEAPGELAPYCDRPWRRALEHLETVPERYLDLPGFSPGAVYEPPFPGGGDKTRMLHDPAAAADELADLGVDLAVLFPDHLLKLAVLPKADYAAALARAYNAWLLEKWLNAEPMFYGALVASPQDPEAAAAEIERYGDEPAVACVYLPAAGVDPLYGHRRYDPIYAAAQEQDLAVVLHSVELVHPVFPFQLQGFDTALARHSIAHPFAMMVNMISMVTTGVPVRFPELRICFMEAGVSWVPFVMHRLDKEYLERRREVPLLQERPSRCIRDFYFGTQPIEEPERPADIVELIRHYDPEVRQTMFASDWPHHDFDHPDHVLQLPFEDGERSRLMGANAERFFRLKTD